MGLSEKARELIEYFEQHIASVPVEERDMVLKRMTSHISALNSDAQNLLQTVQNHKRSADEHNPDLDDLHQFI